MSILTKEGIQKIFNDDWLLMDDCEGLENCTVIKELARMALAAMDSETVEMPLDYLQGHKDGLEWAARLAEANHPDTGDWLYDDPIELAKAIRKGPDMPPVQPVADSEPDRNPVLAYADSYRDMAKQGVESVPIWSVITDLERNIAPLYRHAQPAPVVPEEKPIPNTLSMYAVDAVAAIAEVKGWNACRAAMLAAAPQSPGSEPAAVPGKWIPVSERMPEDDDFVYIWPRPDFGVELHVGQYCERSHKGGGWYAQVYEQNYGIEWHPITVTHWMPLPNPPKEEK
ncbi:TPA: DUF551 domain-containing protein [Klebsiella pneumoniae]|nr:DUF551 domain-containing protein [Klebsiella pneumoniae]